jgi:hypothetical protein
MFGCACASRLHYILLDPPLDYSGSLTVRAFTVACFTSPYKGTETEFLINTNIILPIIKDPENQKSFYIPVQRKLDEWRRPQPLSCFHPPRGGKRAKLIITSDLPNDPSAALLSQSLRT